MLNNTEIIGIDHGNRNMPQDLRWSCPVNLCRFNEIARYILYHSRSDRADSEQAYDI